MRRLPTIVFDINRLIWGWIIAIGLVDAVWMAQAHITADSGKALMAYYVFGGCIILSFFYTFFRRDEHLSLLGQITAQLLLATATIGLLSYLAARTNYPLIDKQLIAFDRDMGFDWRRALTWMDNHPEISDPLTSVYFSIGPELLVIIPLLFMCDQIPHIQRLIIAFVSCALLTIFLATLFPAVGGYVHYNIDISHYAHLHPAAARVHEKALLGMRAHTIEVLAFPLEGIVTFPSFHSALAVLLIYASRKIPLAPLITVPLNLLVLVSTPVDGGHYLTDILGGLMVAYAGIQIAEHLLPRSAVVNPPKTSMDALRR